MSTKRISKPKIDSHYTDNFDPEPADYFQDNNVPFMDATVCKYVLRWRYKNGLRDLHAARNLLNKLIEREE